MSRKTFFVLFIAYAIFWLLVMAIENHGLAAAFSHRQMTPLDLILFVPFLWGYALFAIQNGSIQLKFSTAYRDERPAAFWGAVAACFACGVLLILMAIHRVGR